MADAAHPQPEDNDDGSYDRVASEDDIEGDDTDYESDPVARILKKLKSTGALIKKTVIKHRCKKCDIEFDDPYDQRDHLMQHVALPFVSLTRCDEDGDEREEESDDDGWSSDNDKKDDGVGFAALSMLNPALSKLIVRGPGVNSTINKADSELSIANLKNAGILSIKKVAQGSSEGEGDSANASPEPLKKMETSGTLKMTIKHSSDNKLFEVINGAKSIIKSEKSNGSDDENEWRPEDTKEGILNELLKKTIKAEPQTEYPTPTENTPITIEKVKIKSESSSRPQTPNEANADPAPSAGPKEITVPKPMIIPKVENDASAVIEINCDSDKDDDEVIFIGSPVTQKKESKNLTSSNSSLLQSSLTNVSGKSDKNHDFNWNTPVKTNEPMELLSDKNADALFESLLSNSRKEGESDLGISEYISLDKLGPQHNCDVCHTRFTSLQLLENHRKTSGHSNQMVSSNKSMALSSYQQPGFLMDSLLPVRQLADTVSKIASGNAPTSGAFTHQQNIMVNIQSFPGGMNQAPVGSQPHGPPPHYNYPGMSQMPNPYTARYGMPNQSGTFPNQFPGGPYQPGYPYPQQPPVSNYNPYQPQQPFTQNQFHPNNQAGSNHPMGSAPNYPIGGHPVGPGQNQLMGGSNPMQSPVVSSPQMISNQNMNISHNNKAGPTPGGGVGLPNVIPLPGSDHSEQSGSSFDQNKSMQNGIKIQGIQTANGSQIKAPGPRLLTPNKDIRASMPSVRGNIRSGSRGGGIRPIVRAPIRMSSQAIRGMRPPMRGQMKRPFPGNAQQSPVKKRMDMLLPDKHDNEECEVVSMQQHREGLPLIQSIKGSNSNPPLTLSSQITWKKTVVKPPSPSTNKDTNTMASILAARGIKVTPKQKPAFELPNFGSGISVTSTKSSTTNFSIPEDDSTCSLCNKTFPSSRALGMHMSQSHPNSKLFHCENCPASYPTYVQLHEHKRSFHNSPNTEMGLPVVDLSNHNTLKKLNGLGINHFVPLANRDQGVGCFGVPIVSVQNALSPNLNFGLAGLGSDGILSLGPIKILPKSN